MPRRRPSKANGGSKRPRSVKRSESKINKWNAIDDIPLDEEDQCAFTSKFSAPCNSQAIQSTFPGIKSF